MVRKIRHSHKAHASRSMGPHVRQVIPSAIEHIDPFVFLDHFGPVEKKPGGQGVPPHPHAGIATITYLFSGSNRHQDSYGHDTMVHAGDLAWMQAGKGIVHAEGMNENRLHSETVQGLQFWISLPAKDKFIEPDFFFHSAAELPVIALDQSKLKVLCGEFMGNHSPVKSVSPAYMYEVHMPAGAQLNIPLKKGDTAGLYMISGALETDQQTLLPFTMTSFEQEGDELQLFSKQESHCMIFGGTPLNEPIVAHGSFVMNSMEQINQVVNDFYAGKMGKLEII